MADKMCKLTADNDNAAAPNEDINRLVNELNATYGDGFGINHSEGLTLPNEEEVLNLLQTLIGIVTPGFFERSICSKDYLNYSIGNLLIQAKNQLTDILTRIYQFTDKDSTRNCDHQKIASQVAMDFLNQFPRIREILKKDAEAAYVGDPAVRNRIEIIMSYPGLKALIYYRFAHELFIRKVQLLPRMIGEYAHRITGIDIHPGASIGEGVFIDHGTGVVIGETAELGNNVKLYQGVTLGALSFPKDGCGMIIKGAKRHPTIEDDVTIYAGATILGAVRIGKGSVIGGNVWLTESVEPGTRVTISEPSLSFRKSTRRV